MIKKKALALICWGFLFTFLNGCYKKNYMENTYPFTYYHQPPIAGEQMPERQYAIWGKGDDNGLGHLVDDYIDLFDKYGFSGNGYSLEEHIQAIIEKGDPKLLEHLDFDSNGNEFLVWADSEDAVQRFMEVVLPVFGNAASMEAYLKQADPDEFME